MPRRRTTGKPINRGSHLPTGRPVGGARKPKVGQQELKIRLYTPHEGQMRLHESTARFKIACCGRRWGKTLACANHLAKFSWENPGSETWWVAPTYSQARNAFLTITQGFEPAIASKRSAQGQMEIKWKNGSRTLFKSADRYELLRGAGVHFMVIDEAAFVPVAAWTQVLRPMLTDTMGSAVLISTPKGKNWFYQLYRRGLDPQETDYESFSFPTASSPYILDSEVEEARRTLPGDVFAQEYLGEFLDEVAGVFHNVEQCVYGEFSDPDLLTHRYVVGWDIAKHTDWSVLTVIDTDALRDGKPCHHVAHWERFNQIAYDVQMEKVAALAAKYGAYVLMDSTGLGDPLYDTLAARGVPVMPFHLSTRSKQQIIQNLALSIETKAISFPEIPTLIDELQQYQYEVGPMGNLKYSAPDGAHDDCVISLALAVWAAQHPAWQREPLISMVNEEQISPY